MGKNEYLGEFEQMVLLAVVRLAGNAYGVTIHRELTATTGRDVRRGAVYVALDRLQSKGYVKSAFSDPSAERGGRAKRLYELEAAGRAALKLSRDALLNLWHGIEPELEDV